MDPKRDLVEENNGNFMSIFSHGYSSLWFDRNKCIHSFIIGYSMVLSPRDDISCKENYNYYEEGW